LSARAQLRSKLVCGARYVPSLIPLCLIIRRFCGIVASA